MSQGLGFVSTKTACMLLSFDLQCTHRQRKGASEMNRTQQLKKLFEILVDIHTARNNMHPKVAAQFHVEGFVARHKNDKYFDQLLQEEIEDCSRPTIAA